METPFVYGVIATGEDFTDREEAAQHLVNNFKALTNTMIISPRRWGKSSLVHKASEIAKNEESNLRICHIDLFNVRSETHFYELFAEKIIAATSSKWEEVISAARNLMGRIVPRLNISDGTGAGMTFDFNFNKSDFNPDEILDLPEKIAINKNLKIIVCIDEFQNIAEFSDGEFIMKRLRSHWQLHQNVGYCLYGSKRHIMLEIFNDSSKPFYRFGDFIFLDKIPREYWIPFFIKRYKDTGKEIDVSSANLIAELVDDHPYYCQQLAQISWLRTEKVCTEDIIRRSHITLTEQLSLLFENLTEGLNQQQIAFLHAIINEEKVITSLEVMSKYGISSSTAAIRSRESLVKLDILDKIGKEIHFQDPVYKYWLKTKYFEE